MTNIKTALDKPIRAHIAKIHTTAVCVVLAYDLNAGAPLADVKPVNKKRLIDGSFVEPPTHYACPCPPLLMGEFVIHASYNAGDYVLVDYMERSIDSWDEKGGTNLEPEDKRRHSELDAIVRCRIDPSSRGADSKAVQAGTMTIGSRDGSTRVVIDPTGTITIDAQNIKLGGAASEAVALASKVNKFVQMLDAMFLAWVTVPGDGGAVLKTAYGVARTALYGTGTPIPSPESSNTKAE